MNRVTMRINGTEYSIKGNETEEHLRKVGTTVNKMIESILEKNYMISTQSAAVLAAMNAVDEKLKAEDKLLSVKSQAGSVESGAASLSKEIDDLKLEIDRLRSENQSLSNSIEEKKNSAGDDLLAKDKEIKRLETELHLTSESAREYRDDNEHISKMNKELKFELQSYKYKVLDLQKKLFDTQINQVKDKKERNPVIREKARSTNP